MTTLVGGPTRGSPIALLLRHRWQTLCNKVFQLADMARAQEDAGTERCEMAECATTVATGAVRQDEVTVHLKTNDVHRPTRTPNQNPARVSFCNSARLLTVSALKLRFSTCDSTWRGPGALTSPPCFFVTWKLANSKQLGRNIVHIHTGVARDRGLSSRNIFRHHERHRPETGDINVAHNAFNIEWTGGSVPQSRRATNTTSLQYTVYATRLLRRNWGPTCHPQG